jgi:hypothetical protein
MSTSDPESSTPESAARFRELEQDLVQRLTSEWSRIVPGVLVRRAVQEAVEVAQETEFPTLFLPELASEQVRRIAGALTAAA